jgi:hypothetical protein
MTNELNKADRMTNDALMNRNVPLATSFVSLAGAKRQVDLHPNVAEYLHRCIDGNYVDGK